MSYKNNKGFTLVEISVVLMIIAFLIMGILKAGEMIKNVEITKAVTELKEIEVAVATFNSIYKSIPGDIPDATSKIKGCNIGNYCKNGNADGYLQNYTSIEDTLNYPTGAPTSGSSEERYLFWKHMALADLIKSVNPYANNEPDAIPASSIGGAIIVGSSDGTAGCSIGPDFKPGTWLSIVDDYGNSDCDSKYGFSKKTIYIIDQKIDDGLPYTGNARAGSSLVIPGCVVINAGQAIYNVADDDGTCTISYHIR